MALPALYPDAFFDKDWYTEDEYFALEDRSQARWEWVPDGGPSRPGGPRLGRIRMMSGGTVDHGVIAMNLRRFLGNAFSNVGNQTCRVFGSDVKVHTREGRNTFPDVSVLFGKPVYHAGRRDIITNPILVAEVLSPSTVAYDRSEKWASYQTIPTLQHYLLIAADRARVELYTREEQGWHYAVYEGLETQTSLSALGIALALADLYSLVDFENIATEDL